MKKSNIVQELANIYPSWSKVRTDEQSVGQQVLNPIAVSMERMEKQIRIMRDNQYITTANLDDIDLVFKVQLDADFAFDQDNTDPLFACSLVPEVSGLLEGTWYSVEQAEFNDIESFWYNSIPNRLSIETSGIADFELTSLEAQETPVTGEWQHHLDGGKIWIEATGGVQYLTFEGDQLLRAKVILHGQTRKGTWEEETLIFPWDMKQSTTKEWKQITEIHVYDMEDEVDLDIRSADFNGGPCLSPWNLRYSTNRNKIDEFWDVGHNGTIPTLDRLEYQSDEWQQLVLGFSSKEIIDRWELLDENSNTISGVDIALQPFTDRAWIVTSDNKLYLYELTEDTISGIDDLRDITHGSHIQLDYDESHVLLGEDIEVVPWHARPLKEIQSYRIWYKRPDGQKFGLLNGSSVAYTSDFTVTIPSGTKITRTVENLISIPTTMRGEYLIVFEATFIDNDIHEVRRVFTVRHKEPLVELDLSTIVSGTPDGIDFDTDQKLWVKYGNTCYQIGLHTDIMLIDYTNKKIYFQEEYEEVGIKTL
jgi:hypothetical protein